MEEFEDSLVEVSLVPSSGGVFEVTVDDELVYSKKQSGSLPDTEALLASLRSRGG